MHRLFRNLVVAGLAGCCATTADEPIPALVTRPIDVVPPAMPRRAIAPSAEPLPGEKLEIDDNGSAFTLFLPRGWQVPPSGETIVTFHFHSAIWFAIEEHLRRGLTEPLVCFYPGEGSTVYRKAFEDRERLARLLRRVERELRQRSAPVSTRVAGVNISSFSAGYGAVRELVKSPEYFQLIRRIVLCDSMYASFDETASAGSEPRPAPEHIDPWVPFAKGAARGEKTFVLTHSEVPTSTYASSALCAAALIKAVGAARVDVPGGSVPAAEDSEFPLRYRSDLGNFHVWGYGGTNAHAHMTHARHLADVWKALDAAGQK